MVTPFFMRTHHSWCYPTRSALLGARPRKFERSEHAAEGNGNRLRPPPALGALDDAASLLSLLLHVLPHGGMTGGHRPLDEHFRILPALVALDDAHVYGFAANGISRESLEPALAGVIIPAFPDFGLRKSLNPPY